MARDARVSADALRLLPEVGRALSDKRSVVALESALITHGLPFPRNLEVARGMQAAVRQQLATPATVAMLDGTVRIGLSDDEMSQLAESSIPLKLGRRDLPRAIVEGATGGTTVSATICLATRVGIPVFATGGIGGVHRENPNDVSADLQTLADTAMIVVCAGAKAILDLPATLEYLETMGVAVIGYRTDEFPAFYSRESGLKTSARAESPGEVADFWHAHQALGLRSSVLVVNPVPDADAILRTDIEPLIAQASEEARSREIRGQALTPFLLGRVGDLSKGRSIRANESLLLNNARLAAQIAKALEAPQKGKETPA